MRRRVVPLLIASALTGATLTAVVTAAAPAGATIPASSAQGTYYPNKAQRIFDSRTAGSTRLGQGGSAIITPAVGTDLHPSAVVINLTVVNPTTSGYLTAYPTGKARPNTSSINFAAHSTIANLVTVPVGDGGTFIVYNGLGSADVIVDQLGVYSADDTPLATRGRGGGYNALSAKRVLDTRSDGGGPLGAGFYTTVPFGTGSVPGSQVRAVAVNITVTNGRGSGYLTAWNGASSAPPRVSTLNFTAGATVANSTIVPTSVCATGSCNGSAQIGVANASGGNLDVIVDVLGFFDDGTLAAPVRYVPLPSPVRIVDSRSSLGLPKLLPGSTRTFTPPTTVAGDPTVALDANVTVVRPTATTYLTLWPQLSGFPKPVVSTVNSRTGQVVSNHAIQQVGDANQVNVYNYNGNADVVVDVSGTFEYIATDPGAARAPAPVAVTALPRAAERPVTG